MVLLPEPDWPTSAIVEPASTRNEKSVNTCRRNSNNEASPLVPYGLGVIECAKRP